MNNYSKGSDLTVKWAFLFEDGSKFPLSNYAYQLCYSSGRGINTVSDTSVLSVEEGNILVWRFAGSEQSMKGDYSLSLKLFLSGKLVATLNKRNAFKIVDGCNAGEATLSITSYCDNLSLQEIYSREQERLRDTAEGVRVINEEERLESEQERRTAEDQRKQGETNRQNAFDQSQAQRSETFSANESQRSATFNSNETQRSNTFSTNETARQTAFDTKEAQRDATFNSKEATRDAANQAALNAAEKLTELENKTINPITEVNSTSEGVTPYKFETGHKYIITNKGNTNVTISHRDTPTGASSDAVNVYSNETIEYIPTSDGLYLRYGIGCNLVVMDAESLSYRIDNIFFDKNYDDIVNANIGNLHKTIDWTLGGYIKLSGISLGDVVNTTPTSNVLTAYVIISVKKGERLTLTTQGGNAPRAFGITDESYHLLDVSAPDKSISNKIFYIKEDGYFIANVSDIQRFTYALEKSISVSEYVESINHKFDSNKVIKWNDSRYINTSGSIGSLVDTNATIVHGDYTCLVIPVTKGEVFKFSAQGGNTPRAWAFLDSSKKIVSHSNASVTLNDHEETAPVDGYIVLNSTMSHSHYVTKQIDFIAKIIENKDSISKIGTLFGGSYNFGQSCDGKYTCPNIPALSIPTDRLTYFYGLYDALVSAFPQYVTKVDCDAECISAGITRPSYMDGYPIYMYKFIPSYAPNSVVFSNRNTDVKRLKVFIVSGTHPEYVGIYDLYHTMRLICESWDSDNNLEELRWNVEYYIIPCSSPYGVQNNSRINYNGVDLNRNAPSDDWELRGQGTLTYSGSSPASEYETKVLVHYMESINPNIFIDHHNTNTGAGTAEGDNKNLCYITSRTQFVVDIAGASISQLTRRVKARFTNLFPSNDDDPITQYGFTQITQEKGTRGGYANDFGSVGITYESQQSTMYENGEYGAEHRHTNTTEVCTIATEGFINFLVRLLKKYSQGVREY